MCSFTTKPPKLLSSAATSALQGNTTHCLREPRGSVPRSKRPARSRSYPLSARACGRGYHSPAPSSLGLDRSAPVATCGSIFCPLRCLPDAISLLAHFTFFIPTAQLTPWTQISCLTLCVQETQSETLLTGRRLCNSPSFPGSVLSPCLPSPVCDMTCYLT